MRLILTDVGVFLETLPRTLSAWSGREKSYYVSPIPPEWIRTVCFRQARCFILAIGVPLLIVFPLAPDALGLHAFFREGPFLPFPVLPLYILPSRLPLFYRLFSFSLSTRT